MAKKRYDWEQLRVEFMASEHRVVKDFFIEKFGHASKYVLNKSVGWVKEKDELIT